MRFETSDHFLYPLQDEQGRLYASTGDGFVGFSTVTQNLLGIDGQYGSRYINGETADSLALGTGLRFNGLDTSGGTHQAIGIHPDDIEEFVRRYAAYRAHALGRVEDNAGNWIELDEAALASLHAYLDEIGAYRPWRRSSR